jgi:arginase family enzyme
MSKLAKYCVPYLEVDSFGRGVIGLDVVSGRLIATNSDEIRNVITRSVAGIEESRLNKSLASLFGRERTLEMYPPDPVGICGVPFLDGNAAVGASSVYEIIMGLIDGCPVDFEGQRLFASDVAKLGEISLPQIDQVSAQVVLGTVAFLLTSLKRRVLYVGTRHAMTYPILRAMRMAFRDVGLVWIDAHTDMYHFERLASHDARRFSDANVLARLLEDDPSLIDKTILVGTSVMGDEYRQFLHRDQIFTISDIESRGTPCVAREILEHLQTSRIYASVDLDVVDPAFAPSVNTPVAGGLTSREVLKLISFLCKSNKLFGADIVEMNPGDEFAKQTAPLTTRIAVELLVGLKRFGR